MVLWKKESDSADAPFIDLFERFGSSYMVASFKEWDHHLEAAEWKHHFMLREIDPGKNNKTSDYLRELGNRKFQERDFIEAMELYSQSLCFAKPRTNNVCFAYANRATCFLRMKKFDKCLRDIDLAVKANYPFVPKLMERKAKCQQEMEKAASKKESIEPKLSFEPNEKHPCMANVLEVQKNTTFGRHIIVKNDIAVGETVLIEKSYVSLGCVIDGVLCYGCLKEERNFIACPKCTDVMFCSNECQNNTIHKKICGENLNRMPHQVRFLAQSVLAGVVAFSTANDLMQFVNNILQQRSNIPALAGDDQTSEYGFFLSLQSATRILDLKAINLIYKVFTAQLKIPFVSAMFNTLKNPRFLMHLIAEHLFIVRNNSFKLCVPGGILDKS